MHFSLIKSLSEKNSGLGVEVLPINELLPTIRSHCSKSIFSLKNRNIIWRGSKTQIDNGTFKIVSLNNSYRSSSTSSNYYIDFMNHCPSLKDYPNRNKSLICCTEKEYASRYAASDKPYVVVPFDGTLIGVCPFIDMWNTHLYMWGERVVIENIESVFLPWQNGSSWDTIIHVLHDMRFNDKFPDDYVTDQLYALSGIFSYRKAMQSVEKLITADHHLNPSSKEEYSRKLLSILGYEFIPQINEAFNPKNSKLALAVAGDALPSLNEVWFSNKAIIMTEESYNNTVNEL